MKPIVIATYDYDPGSGGIKVMHKLCDMLNNNGFKSYLTPIFNNHDFKTTSEYNTPILFRDEVINLEDKVVLYPEGIQHNPLEAQNVVRWILGPSHQHDAETYSKSDLVYWYMDYYYTDFLGQKENQLNIAEFHDGVFTNKGYQREGSCFTIRKGKPEHQIHPPDARSLSFEDGRNQEELSEIFNKTEKFYCYDNYTFLYTQAAMCGCISIVVPDPDSNKEHWLGGSRLNKYGVAFGEDDIPRALETLPLMFKEIEQIKLEMNEKVIKFAEHCQDYFK